MLDKTGGTDRRFIIVIESIGIIIVLVGILLLYLMNVI